MFKGIPKKVRLAILLFEALDLPLALKLSQTIIYLWREFKVKVSVKPIIKSFVINFHYKDECLLSYGTSDLRDLVRVAEEIKQTQVNKEIKMLEDKLNRKDKKENDDR